jgi:hypothetical protein
MTVSNKVWRLFFEGPGPDGGAGGMGGGGDSGGGGGTSDLGDVISASLEGQGGREGATPSSDQPSPEEEAELAALEKDILAKNPGMASGAIKVHRHQAVLTRARNQFAKEKADYDQKLAQYERDQAEWQRYAWAKDPEVHQALQALALAETDQDKFVELLLQDPRFAERIQLKGQPTQPAQLQGRPGPNATSPDGQYKFYDEDGLQALLQWERQQTTKAAVEEAKREWAKEFGPVREEYEARNAWSQALDSSRGVLDQARAQWPGFTENEPAIKQALIKNDTWDLNDAYRHVVVNQLQSQTKLSRDQMRKELLAEMNRKPGAVGQIPGNGRPESRASDAPRDIADVIRDSLASVR